MQPVPGFKHSSSPCYDIHHHHRRLTSQDKALKRLEVSQLLCLDEKTIPLLCTGLAQVAQVHLDFTLMVHHDGTPRWYTREQVFLAVVVLSNTTALEGSLFNYPLYHHLPPAGEASMVWPTTLPSVELPCSRACQCQ